MQDFIIHAVGITLLHSLWQAALLAAVAGTLLLLTRHTGSALRYKLLCTLMLFFVAVVGYTFCGQLLAGRNAAAIANSSFTVYGSAAVSKQSSVGLSADSRVIQLVTACTVFFNQYSWLLVLVWFVFFLVRFVKLLLGMVNVDRLRYYKTNMVADAWEQKFNELCNRLHVKQPVLLMESAVLKIPVLIGYLKPVILIPAGMLTQLSAAQVEVILLHELAHVRRHDYLVNLVQNGIDTVFFFNPAILWISALVRTERECCCDDIAVLETKNRQQFVQALISFNQYSSTLKTCSLSWLNGGKGQLLRRVQRIVTNQNSSLRSAELVVLLSITLLGSSAFMLFKQHPASDISGNIPAIADQPSLPKYMAPVKFSITSSHVNNKATAKPATITGIQTAGTALPKKPVMNKKPAAVIPRMPAPVTTVVPSEPPAIETESPDLHAEGLADLQKQLAALGYNENRTERLQAFLDHGVTPSFMKSFIEAGYNKISMDQFLELRDHGVRVSFVRDLQKRGYGTVSLERATTLIDHGVSVAFIEGFSRLGFNVTLEEAINLKDHGVSAAFIESFKNKTDHLLPLEDYIKIRDSGINRSS
jgi:beta-lactamase regulating signal transducer with metallopeptidase domain